VVGVGFHGVGLVWVGLGWVGLGEKGSDLLGVMGLSFAELVAKLRSIGLILKPFDSSKGGFVGRLVAKDCGLMSERDEGGFEDAVGDGVVCHALKIRRRQRECKKFVRFFCVGGEGVGLSSLCAWIK
jgi:hypothetical protein